MERLLQYMDDIDDLYGAFGLLYEKLRRAVLKLLTLCAGLIIVAAGIALALVHPPIALATCIVLFVTLLYRSATSPARAPIESI